MLPRDRPHRHPVPLRCLVPWAWAINGCASVLSAILATLLAMTFGTRAVVLTAAALYLLAGAAFARTSRAPKP